MLNIITIHAIRKTSSLSKPLKTLPLSLAVSDLRVGLLAQPFYIACLVIALQQNNDNNHTFNATSVAFRITGLIFTFASLFGVLSLSADRFLAIYLHLRYQELVTHKRVVAVVVSTWLLSGIISSMYYWNPDIFNVIAGIVPTACIITTTFLNLNIYLTVRRHAHQIQALQVHQVAQNEEMANVGRLKKSAFTAVYVYLVFLFCYLPLICWGIADGPPESDTIPNTDPGLYFLTLVYLNSSLNPLMYCWKMRHIRHNIIYIFRNAFSCYN